MKLDPTKRPGRRTKWDLKAQAELFLRFAIEKALQPNLPLRLIAKGFTKPGAPYSGERYMSVYQRYQEAKRTVSHTDLLNFGIRRKEADYLLRIVKFRAHGNPWPTGETRPRGRKSL